MKSLLYRSLGTLAILLSACASTRQVAVLGPVGPPPFGRARHTPEGELLVYSAFDVGMSSDPDACPHHSGYRINSADGKQLKYVNNWVGTFLGDPAAVSLAPGRYSVVARAAASRMVTVPVTIEAGKTTTVHLDGRNSPVGARQTSESHLVRLPDGWIVGWRAHDANE